MKAFISENLDNPEEKIYGVRKIKDEKYRKQTAVIRTETEYGKIFYSGILVIFYEKKKGRSTPYYHRIHAETN